MIPSVTVAVLTVATVVGLSLILAWWARKLRERTSEPIIELERLTNCRSCGSLIPEGVRRCAFCGSWQQQPVPENK